MQYNPGATSKLHSKPWQIPAWQLRFLVLTLGAAALILFVRCYRLASIQTDLYGDIEIAHTYIGFILDGDWPFHFALSAGPLYHYLVVPILWIVGFDYTGLKLASVVIGLGVLLATYALGRRLVNDYFALLATTVAGISSWLLIWSRLGNSQIVVPLLTTAAGWLLLRAVQEGRTTDFVACAVVSTLGLYAYPQSFVLPGVSLATLLCLRWAGHTIAWRQLRLFVLVTIICALPFARIVMLDPANFLNGYIGSKIVTQENTLTRFFSNFVKAALAFHFHGDSIFRSNPVGAPHLDSISGVLFLVGAVFWLMPDRRRWCAALFVPFVLLQLPSMLVLGRPEEVPSASRTLGVAPIAYVLVASGIWWLVQILIRAIQQRQNILPVAASLANQNPEPTPLFKQAHAMPSWATNMLSPQAAGATLGAVLLCAIFILNMQRYFGDYIGGLPYHDTSIAERIAAYTATLPPETQVYLAGCCWEAGMPETPFVKLMAPRPETIQQLDPEQLTCESLRSLSQPAVLVWNFRVTLPTTQLEQCRQSLPAQLYVSPAGLPVFRAAPLQFDMSVSATAGQQAEQLERSEVEIDGQMVGVHYSPLDLGQVTDLFDNNGETLIRGRDANPLIIELYFEQPRDISTLGLDLTTMGLFRVRAELIAADGQTTSIYEEYFDLPADPHVDLLVPNSPAQVLTVRIAIEDLRSEPDEGYHIHMRGLQIQ